MEAEFKGTQNFHIYSSFTLSSDDVSALSLLYAPLIGSDAFMLYMGLFSFIERDNLKSEEILHQDLFDMYSWKCGDFLNARRKLEGIGLLITYERSGDYIYVLLPPLSPKNFIKDATYGLYLYSKVRKEAFYFIKKHFEIEKADTEGYQNITKAFDEVFSSKIDKDATMEKFSYILGKSSSEYLSIKNPKFSFEDFLKQINTDFLEAGVTMTFRKQITDLAFVYGFTESNMTSLYMDSINKNGFFDYRILKKKANVLFIYLRNMDAPKLVAKEENKEGKTDDLISYLENSSPKDILAGIVPDYPEKYLEIINDIYASINLPRGVINVMILKTLKDKGGDLPNASYFKKVADSWIRDNVLSTVDAVKYITTVKEKTVTTKKDAGFTSQSKTEITWEEL